MLTAFGKYFVLLLCPGLLFASGCTVQKLEVGPVTLKEDTVWQGVVKVTGDVYVPPGVTLTIAPGTTVKFVSIDEKSDRNLFGIDEPYYPQAELIVRGKLIARGAKDNIIVFTSAESDAKPADWGAINLLGNNNNVIENCKILFAYNGIHAHGAAAMINYNEFTKNAVAISVKKEEETPGVPWFGRQSDIQVSHNYIHDNKGGITFRNSRAVITRNTITDNKFFGIWPKEKTQGEITGNEISGNLKGIYFYKSAGLAIATNNIYNNKEYNLAIADEQETDIDVRNNWFGTTDVEKIQQLIFDRHFDATVAAINIDPILPQRVKEAGQ